MEFNSVVKENTGFLPSVVAVFKNIAVTYLIMIVCLFVFAIVVTYTDFPEAVVPSVVLVMSIISIMFAGVLTARRNKTKGWLCGAVSGTLYMITLYILSCFAFRSADFGPDTVAMLAIGVFSGTFGGILGINMKGAKR